MNTRARRAPARRQESSGGNVLFTLGLISVVTLLIVGYVMTQGGIMGIAAKMPDEVIFLQPTPTPSAQAAAQPTPEADQQRLLAQLRTDYEAKLKLEQDAATKRIEEVRKQYESKINDLELRLKLMHAENERLRGGQ